MIVNEANTAPNPPAEVIGHLDRGALGTASGFDEGIHVIEILLERAAP